MDDIDYAQQDEALFRETALFETLRNEREEPLEKAGIRLCIECEKRIPRRRLKVEPNAVRCVTCQEREERERKRRHYV